MDKAQELQEQLAILAEKQGYKLNPNTDFTLSLCQGLIKNNQRYGFMACPCRLVIGGASENKDIICPCIYRDNDLQQFGACFCALYVTDKYNPTLQIVDRRLDAKPKAVKTTDTKLPYPVWRCDVCGYLSAKDNTPPICPICGASNDHFERFM